MPADVLVYEEDGDRLIHIAPFGEGLYQYQLYTLCKGRRNPILHGPLTWAFDKTLTCLRCWAMAGRQYK